MVRHLKHKQNESQGKAVAGVSLFEELKAPNLVRFAFLCIFSIFLALPVGGQTQPPSALVDNFDEPTLNSAWQLHPGVGQISLTANPGFLRYLLGAPQFNGAINDNNTLWVFRQFSGDSWTLETKVTYFLSPSENGRQMFVRIPFPDISGRNVNEIRWYRDIDCCGPRNHVVVDFTENGQISPGADFPPNATDTYVVRIIRTKQAVNVQVSPDGTSFSSVAQHTFATPLPVLQDVVLSSSNFCCSGHADYDYVKVSSSACEVDFEHSVRSFPAGPPSADKMPTTMNGIFVPTDSSGNPASLASAATDCNFDITQGFSGFNWQQTVDNLPTPSPYATVDGTALKTAFLDPPTSAGYTYDQLGTANLYPFYYGPNSCAFRDPIDGCVIPVQLGTTVLNFLDSAPDSCLPGGTGTGCFGLTVPPGPQSHLEFTTTLVGISTTSSAQSSICAPNSTLYCTPLSSWRWKSTFNGTSGGVSKLNDLAPDPGSGTGGVTIISINRVLQTPPSVTCSATPNALWPPNGIPVPVTVSGMVTAGTQTIPTGGTTFAVTDEYGEDQPIGSIALNADGSYSFTVSLIAARNGTDRNDRTYTINVIAADAIGNASSCAAAVTVPHDQGHN